MQQRHSPISKSIHGPKTFWYLVRLQLYFHFLMKKSVEQSVGQKTQLKLKIQDFFQINIMKKLSGISQFYSNNPKGNQL